MIAFGCASSDERRFRAGAANAIEVVAEPDSLLMRRHAPAALGRAYDELLAAAAEHDDLEALVLIDQSVARLAPGFTGRVRRLLAASPEVAVVGVGVAAGAREAEFVDGPLVVLSAWAARELSCDPGVCGAFATLALDLSLQARALGRRVVSSSALVLAHAPVEIPAPRERRAWLRSVAAVRRKWPADCPSALTP